jgi:putative FmdB family regulatory protein
VPIYEFRCGACGERFEALVDVDTEATECRVCGTAGARRVPSVPSPPPHLVKSAGSRRKRERANEKLRTETKARFEESRRTARERRGTRGG